MLISGILSAVALFYALRAGEKPTLLVLALLCAACIVGVTIGLGYLRR